MDAQEQETLLALTGFAIIATIAIIGGSVLLGVGVRLFCWAAGV